MASRNEMDEQVVARALRMIGQEAGRPDPGSTPAEAPIPFGRPRRRRRMAVVSLAAVAVAATITVILLVPSGDESPAQQSGQGQTLTEWISCASTIAVGDVTAVQDDRSRDGRITVEFNVTERIKPHEGKEKITLDVVDPAQADEQKRVEPGQHVLIVVPRRYDEELGIFQGAELVKYRALVKGHLDEAAHTPCPAFWSQTHP
ncbi:hypothetical protein [Streptomyces sp. NPDC005752]|uniref:hypothetical protein n=1 Tax=Streptomyces sp. NPDC005752 TaxID=3157065 RepID=UPI0033CECDC4